MKKYHILFIAFLLIIPQLLVAQNFADAFRFSNYQVVGTARSAGMGNAFGAIGGDFTALSINPAGSAIYQKGEFVLTPVYNINTTERKMGEKLFSDNSQSFSFSNIGAIGSFRANSNQSGLVNISYGIGYNQLANFKRNSFGNINQSETSYLDDITHYANSEKLANGYLKKSIGEIEYRDWPTKLAWNNYLIDPAKDQNNQVIDGQYVSILNEGDKIDQRKTYTEEGRINEYVFNLGVNFEHKLYLGTTLGLNNFTYTRFSNYEELKGNNSLFKFNDELNIDAYGFNLKLGAIYKPVQNVRLGLAFHSPTWYEVEDKSVLSMKSNNGQENYSSGTNKYKYEFNSPLKVVFSSGVFFNKRGFLSIDAEYQNYEAMRFRRGGNGSDSFNDLNTEMGNVFKNVLNFRVGGEFKLTSQFTARAGYEHYGNPFRKTLTDLTSLTDNMSTISAGLGYAVNSFSINVAYRHSNAKFSDVGVQPNYHQVPLSNTNQNVMLSLGFRF